MQGWNVDDISRYLFAHTRGFREWSGTRKVDSLALQMRTWLRRDLAPLVRGTVFFSSALRPGIIPRHRHDFALALLGEVGAWMKRGAPLDCFVAPLYDSPPVLPRVSCMQIHAKALAAVGAIPHSTDRVLLLRAAHQHADDDDRTHTPDAIASMTVVAEPERSDERMLRWLELGAHIWHAKRHADNQLQWQNGGTALMRYEGPPKRGRRRHRASANDTIAAAIVISPSPSSSSSSYSSGSSLDHDADENSYLILADILSSL